MKGRSAKIIFLIASIVLAVLLLTKIITTIISGFVFAIALILLGGLSKGFRKK